MTADNNCKWSQWSEWSSCSQRCDVSQRNRSRQCLTSCTDDDVHDAVDIENCLRENCSGNIICQLFVNVCLCIYIANKIVYI